MTYFDLPERPRRLRRSDSLRRLVRETVISTDDFIMPLFIIHGQNIKQPIASMPGMYQWSIDRVSEIVGVNLLKNYASEAILSVSR